MSLDGHEILLYSPPRLPSRSTKMGNETEPDPTDLFSDEEMDRTENILKQQLAAINTMLIALRRVATWATELVETEYDHAENQYHSDGAEKIVFLHQEFRGVCHECRALWPCPTEKLRVAVRVWQRIAAEYQEKKE